MMSKHKIIRGKEGSKFRLSIIYDLLKVKGWDKLVHCINGQMLERNSTSVVRRTGLLLVDVSDNRFGCWQAPEPS